MWPSWAPIVDDERKNDRARSRFPVSNVFTPESRPNSVTAKAFRRTTPVADVVSSEPANLIGAMIGRDAKQGETKEGLERKFDTPWHGP